VSPSQPRTQLPDLFTDQQWAAMADRLRLSKRQRQAARLICLGCSNTTISRELGIKRDTVRMHNRELFQKLGVRQRMGVLIRMVLTDREMTTHAAGEATP